jgi:hypothetical protein
MAVGSHPAFLKIINIIGSLLKLTHLPLIPSLNLRTLNWGYLPIRAKQTWRA